MFRKTNVVVFGGSKLKLDLSDSALHAEYNGIVFVAICATFV